MNIVVPYNGAFYCRMYKALSHNAHTHTQYRIMTTNQQNSNIIIGVEKDTRAFSSMAGKQKARKKEKAFSDIQEMAVAPDAISNKSHVFSISVS